MEVFVCQIYFVIKYVQLEQSSARICLLFGCIETDCGAPRRLDVGEGRMPRQSGPRRDGVSSELLNLPAPATHQCNRLLFDRLPADMDRWELWWALEIVGFTFYMHIFSEIDSILVNNFNRGLLYFCSALKTQGLTYNCKIVIYEIHVFNSTQLVMIDD